LKFLVLRDQAEFDYVNGLINNFEGLDGISSTWAEPISYLDPNDTRKIISIKEEHINMLSEIDHDFKYLVQDDYPFDYIKENYPDISLEEFKYYFDLTMKKKITWGNHVIMEFRAFIVKNLNPDSATSVNMFSLYDQMLTLLSTGALQESHDVFQTLNDSTLDSPYDANDTVRQHFSKEILRGL